MHDNALLGVVSVLILIYKNESQRVGIDLQNVLMLLEKKVGIEQQVIKVHGVAGLASLLIDGVYLCGLWHFVSIVPAGGVWVSGILLCGDEHVFCRRYTVVYVSGLVHLVVKAQFLYHGL